MGGEISSTVLKHMNYFGRVSVCGAISSYNDDIKGMCIYRSYQRGSIKTKIEIWSLILDSVFLIYTQRPT